MNWKHGIWALALTSVLAIQGCGDDDDTGTGGTGGSSGGGGSAGAGGEAGAGGATGGASGAGGTAGMAAMNTPPEATIVTPAMDSGTSNSDFAYDGFDDDLGLWYTDVVVEGSGEDAEDGSLTGDALVWKTNQTGIQAEVVGTGTNPTLRLYSQVCEGTEHLITLEVTDGDGATTASPARMIVIWTLC